MDHFCRRDDTLQIDEGFVDEKKSKIGSLYLKWNGYGVQALYFFGICYHPIQMKVFDSEKKKMRTAQIDVQTHYCIISNVFFSCTFCENVYMLTLCQNTVLHLFRLLQIPIVASSKHRQSRIFASNVALRDNS